MACGHSHGNANLPTILSGATVLGYQQRQHLHFTLPKIAPHTRHSAQLEKHRNPVRERGLPGWVTAVDVEQPAKAKRSSPIPAVWLAGKCPSYSKVVAQKYIVCFTPATWRVGALPE